jgi:hypothetical protein
MPPPDVTVVMPVVWFDDADKFVIPLETPWTSPPASTVAIVVSEEVHVTDAVTSFFVPSVKKAVAVNC